MTGNLFFLGSDALGAGGVLQLGLEPAAVFVLAYISGLVCDVCEWAMASVLHDGRSPALPVRSPALPSIRAVRAFCDQRAEAVWHYRHAS